MTMEDEERAADGHARRLVGEAGLGDLICRSPLSGGRNNRVHLVVASGGAATVMKSYFRDARDPRDRRGAEWAFLTLAWKRGVRAVPEPLATDEAAGVSLMRHVEGGRLAPGAVTRAHVDAAIDLVCAVNPRPPALAEGMLPAASEACFSLSEHLATVDRRVARLAALDPAAPCADAAAALVRERLLPSWREIRARLETARVTATGAGADTRLSEAETCFSPSDFGFHNALVAHDGRITFLDFEYAGRDDPAKLVSDFFCQPELPAPICHHAHMIDRLAAGLGLDGAFRDRSALLLDAYRIKWVCIMLNDFLPLGDARRGFATAQAREARCAEQLAKAQAALDALAP
jgi:hypothetical protein